MVAQRATDWLDKFLASQAISDLLGEVGEASTRQVRADIGSAQYKLVESLVDPFSKILFKTLVVSDDGEPAIIKEVHPHEVYEQFCLFAESVIESFRKSLGDLNVLESAVAPALLTALVPNERALLQGLERPADDQFRDDPGWYEPIREMESQLDGLWEDTIFRCVTDPKVRHNGDVFVLPAWPRLLLAMRDEEIRCDFLRTVGERIGLWSLKFTPETGQPVEEEPASQKRVGRPKSLKNHDEALAAYLAGEGNEAVAKILHDSQRVSRRQKQDVPTNLKHFVVSHPDLPGLMKRHPALETHKYAKGWVEKASNK